MDYEAQMTWSAKHPGVNYYISYADGTITFWKETRGGKIIRTETYSLTKEELMDGLHARTPLLDKYYAKFMKREKQ